MLTDRKSKAAPLLVLALLGLGMTASAPPAYAAKLNPTVERGIGDYNAGNFDAALKTLTPLADSGNTQACYWVGRMYERGVGTVRDTDKAVTYYRKAAEAGLKEAKLRLGEIYYHGTEELQDFAKARKWLEKAALDGVPIAQQDLATLYANGWGGKTDKIMAYVWYEFAARHADYEAQTLRDKLIMTMSSDQLTEAQQLSRKMATDMASRTKGQTDKPADES